MKKKRVLIITIIITIILLCLIALINIIEIEPKGATKKSSKLELFDAPECVKASNICSSEEIYQGLKLKVKVSEDNIKEFYIIGNDNISLTLLSADTVEKNIKFAEKNNLMGPINLLEVLREKTNDWDLIDYMNFFHYIDYINSEDYIPEEIVSNGTVSGYSSFTIYKGKANINFMKLDKDLNTTYNFKRSFRARAVTYEEIHNLEKDGVLPDYLKDKDFWTISSAPGEKSKNAYAVVDGKLVSKNIETKLGILPVIYIDKQLIN